MDGLMGYHSSDGWLNGLPFIEWMAQWATVLCYDCCHGVLLLWRPPPPSCLAALYGTPCPPPALPPCRAPHVHLLPCRPVGHTTPCPPPAFCLRSVQSG